MEYTISNVFELFLQQNRDRFPNVTVDEMLSTNEWTNISIDDAVYDDKNYKLVSYHLLSIGCSNFVGNSDIVGVIEFLKPYLTSDYYFKYNVNEEGIWLDVYYYNKPALSDLVERFDSRLNAIALQVLSSRQHKTRKEEILEQIRILTKELEKL